MARRSTPPRVVPLASAATRRCSVCLAAEGRAAGHPSAALHPRGREPRFLIPSKTPKVEVSYWATITFSQTPGPALGDCLALAPNVGYIGAALVFGSALLAVTGKYFYTNDSHVGLFWVDFMLTRPLGAAVGDFLDKPVTEGGLDISRPEATLILAVFIVACILIARFKTQASHATSA